MNVLSHRQPETLLKALVVTMVLLLQTSVAGKVFAQEGEGFSTERGDSRSVTPPPSLIERLKELDSLRVVVHAQPETVRMSEQLSALLTDLGVRRVETRVVKSVPGVNEVRFFREPDRGAGGAVAEALRLVFDDVEVRNFGRYRPKPSPGLIEVWLEPR